MKNFKILTKVVSITAMGIMLLTSGIGATTLSSRTPSTTQTTTPKMNQATRQYTDMVSKASVFGSAQQAVALSFSKVCIPTSTLDYAIQAARAAAADASGLAFVDGSEKPYTGPFYFNFPAGTVAYVKDTGAVSRIKADLIRASIPGLVNLSLVSQVVNQQVKTLDKTGTYYDKLYLNVSYKAGIPGTQLNIVNFSQNSATGLVNAAALSTTFTNYANFLTSVKAFYTAAGCYTPVKPPTPPPATIKDAVIYANDRTIRIRTKFNIMQGVTARDNAGKGADLTNKVTVYGKVNTGVLGKTKLTYSVKGANGRTVSKTVTITVVR